MQFFILSGLRTLQLPKHLVMPEDHTSVKNHNFAFSQFYLSMLGAWLSWQPARLLRVKDKTYLGTTVTSRSPQLLMQWGYDWCSYSENSLDLNCEREGIIVTNVWISRHMSSLCTSSVEGMTHHLNLPLQIPFPQLLAINTMLHFFP